MRSLTYLTPTKVRSEELKPGQWPHGTTFTKELINRIKSNTTLSPRKESAFEKNRRLSASQLSISTSKRLHQLKVREFPRPQSSWFERTEVSRVRTRSISTLIAAIWPAWWNLPPSNWLRAVASILPDARAIYRRWRPSKLYQTLHQLQSSRTQRTPKRTFHPTSKTKNNSKSSMASWKRYKTLVTSPNDFRVKMSRQSSR